jgi:NTP pyrophosphatase (non-canonical NTP hydrolase)
MRELIKKVEKWGEDKEILSKSSLNDQMDKLEEELDELWAAIVKKDNNEITDGIGDCTVVLTLMARLHGKTLEQCLSHAWNEIKDRTGKMENGVFVKDA